MILTDEEEIGEDSAEEEFAERSFSLDGYRSCYFHKGMRRKIKQASETIQDVARTTPSTTSSKPPVITTLPASLPFVKPVRRPAHGVWWSCLPGL